MKLQYVKTLDVTYDLNDDLNVLGPNNYRRVISVNEDEATVTVRAASDHFLSDPSTMTITLSSVEIIDPSQLPDDLKQEFKIK